MNPSPAPHSNRKHTMILVGSLIGGLVSAAALVAVPFSDGQDSAVTGALLLGFAFGWALIALLTTRFTDRPERWAAVPAAAMAVAATALLVLTPSDATMTTLGWIWPPLVVALVAWMIVQVRRQPRSRARSLLLYPVFGVLALAATGCSYETVLSATEGPARLAPGQRLVDVGGHRLAVHCTGTGSPTVVLEPGLGESARAMARWIAPSVSRTTRICVYDQAGHGLSEAAPEGKTDAARDLHVLLERSNIPGPYVIAGHSLGGIHTLNYARRYPNDVAGVVLLDSMSPQQTSMFEGADPVLDLLPSLARTGIARLLVDLRDGEPTAQARAFVRDVKAMPAELNQAAKLKSLGSRPLAVVTAGEGSQAGWAADQDALAKLSTNSDHRTIAGSTHASLIEDETHAAQSSQAIRDIVEAVRKAAPTS
jgi:pimeloyl-ACP methyl ester carboxylesterase